MLGNLRFMVRCGTSGNVLRGFSQRWVDDPFGTYAAEIERGDDWCAANGIAYEHMLYLPGGHTPGIMQFNGFLLLRSINRYMAETIARVFRNTAEAADEDTHHSVYLGCLPAFKWRTRRELEACVEPYQADEKKASMFIDKMTGWPQTRVNERIIGDLCDRFDDVIAEGGLTAADAWMRLPIAHTAQTHEDVYAARPDKYLPPKHVIVSNVPDRLAGEPREVKTAWKREQAAAWRRRGVHVYIEAGEVQGVGIEDLGGRGAS